MRNYIHSRTMNYTQFFFLKKTTIFQKKIIIMKKLSQKKKIHKTSPDVNQDKSFDLVRPNSTLFLWLRTNVNSSCSFNLPQSLDEMIRKFSVYFECIEWCFEYTILAEYHMLCVFFSRTPYAMLAAWELITCRYKSSWRMIQVYGSELIDGMKKVTDYGRTQHFACLLGSS